MFLRENLLGLGLKLGLRMPLFRSLAENDNFISLRISELKKTSHYKINTSIMLVSLQSPHVLFTFIHVNMNGK